MGSGRGGVVHITSERWLGWTAFGGQPFFWSRGNGGSYPHQLISYHSISGVQYHDDRGHGRTDMTICQRHFSFIPGPEKKKSNPSHMRFQDSDKAEHFKGVRSDRGCYVTASIR